MRILAAVIGIGFLGLASPSMAQSVTLTPTREGVRADYRLEASTDRVVFDDQGVVRADWDGASPGLTMDATGVRLNVAADQFGLRLRPDSTEDGRGYIPLVRLGEGYVLHAPSLTLQSQPLDLDVGLPDGWTVLPDGPFDGYLYLGPRDAVDERPNGALHIAADANPKPMVAGLFNAFDAAVTFFTERFGPLPRRPVLAVTHQGAGPMPFRGDVTDSGMISIRMDGTLAESTDANMLSQTGHFAFHEASHLWNSHLALPADGSPWLHEGGAEYLALVGQTSTGQIDEAQARAELSQRLNDCRAGLGQRPDAEARINGSSAIYYSCGTVIQWLADMELRRGGGDGVAGVWASFVDRARHGRPDYGPADFRAALGASSAAFILLDADPETRWAEIDAALTALGVRWRNQPSSPSLIAAALRHLKAQACPGGTSFTLRDGYIEMQNGADCGPLTGAFDLGTVEGHDPMSATSEMFGAVQARCAARDMIRVTRRGSTEVVFVPCSADLTTPVAYDLTEIPAVSLPPT